MTANHSNIIMPRVDAMHRLTGLARFLVSVSILLVASVVVNGQRTATASIRDDSSDFGPVMRAYLGYLGNEQEVVDDRNSRREITAAYYRRNSNRIRALRMMAMRLVRQTGNDYVPELEAVTLDELRTLFETPPKLASLHASETIDNKFRYLGSVYSGEAFYVFARLDPYEQAELIQQQTKQAAGAGVGGSSGTANGLRVGEAATRPRRAAPR
jgi:hypothetical protein